MQKYPEYCWLEQSVKKTRKMVSELRTLEKEMIKDFYNISFNDLFEFNFNYGGINYIIQTLNSDRILEIIEDIIYFPYPLEEKEVLIQDNESFTARIN